MADDTGRINTGRLRLFDRAVRIKWGKYTWSGLAIVVAGLLILLIRMVASTAGSSVNVLLVGLGILLILIGVIRVLIGFINPATPLDMVTPVEPPEQVLQSEIFEAPTPPADE